ncbi:MAG: hypothetical protein VXV96_14695 [Bdellovibrionota bacterium]|nr:hypothetical protein [Bdellovibrionota bacterium]
MQNNNKAEHLLVVSFLILCTFIITVIDLANTGRSTVILANIGSWLSGLGTIIAAIFAIIKVPDGIQTWKLKKFTDKKMEIAIDLLESVADFVSGVAYLTNPLSYGSTAASKDRESGDYFTNLMDERLEEIWKDIQRFHETKRKAEVFLSTEKEILSILEEVKQQWVELSVAIKMYANASAEERRDDFFIKQHRIVYDQKRATLLKNAQTELCSLIEGFAKNN